MTTDISVVRWDPSQGPGSEYIDEYEYDGGNSSSRLFERSRIKALAGKIDTPNSRPEFHFIRIAVIKIVSNVSCEFSFPFFFAFC